VIDAALTLWSSDDPLASRRPRSDKGTRMSRLLHEAFLRFRDRLALARPSERAVQMGLSER
jgi:hypothetical protein